MTKIKLLDLCCGAGDCSVGYKQAAEELGIDIEIVGVDLVEQPNYPFKFIRGDALEFLITDGGAFSHIHASPPCQEYSAMSNCSKGNGKIYKSNLPEIKNAMYAIDGVPGVIENVPVSPLRKDIQLSGNMFGLGLSGIGYSRP
jgi:DNA (cytosine-5)-methyltransferase 1